MSILGLKERLIERANIIMTRLNEENAKLAKKQATFQRNQRDNDPQAEEDFERFCSEAMFRIQILGAWHQFLMSLPLSHLNHMHRAKTFDTRGDCSPQIPRYGRKVMRYFFDDPDFSLMIVVRVGDPRLRILQASWLITLVSRVLWGPYSVRSVIETREFPCQKMRSIYWSLNRHLCGIAKEPLEFAGDVDGSIN